MIKLFENYNDKTCKAELLILHRKSGEYRLLVKLISSTGDNFSMDGMFINEHDVKKFVNEFGAKIEER